MMAAYELEQLLKLWASEKLTTEQAVGQLMQQLLILDTRIGQLERRFEKLHRPTNQKPNKQ